MTDPNSYINPVNAHCGLTKREHFAALAMQGLLANPDYSSQDFQTAAKVSVAQAEALIAALNEEPK